MTVEEATAKFPQDAGIARYGEPEEIAELMAFLVSPGCALDDGLDAADGWRRGQIDLTPDCANGTKAGMSAGSSGGSRNGGLPLSHACVSQGNRVPNLQDFVPNFVPIAAAFAL